jgi:hypothetical protein
MQADPASADGGFSVALLNPASPVPVVVKGPAERRFAVYRNNVTLGLVRALEANFPAIRRLLGEAYFAGLAREFVQRHPPASPLLFYYGEHFPAHLARQEDLADYPYLADVARLEQQWRRSYHEADAPVLQPSSISGLDERQIADVRLSVHPAGALMQSDFAVHSIFQANRFHGVAAPKDFTVPEYVVVSRPALDVHTRTVSAAQYAFLSTLWNGAELGLAAERAMTVDADFDIVAAIRLMLDSGLFQEVT